MPMYNKKSTFITGDRRNPCTFTIKRVNRAGDFEERKSYGFVQDRDMKNKLYYILTGTGGDEMWYPMENVTLVKGHWTNKKKDKIENL
jgi:hypothetical protein|tara:strand:- start:756 stop:1019 length:264 start_codon:yes stop_codon:yes gene_type:complete